MVSEKVSPASRSFSDVRVWEPQQPLPAIALTDDRSKPPIVWLCPTAKVAMALCVPASFPEQLSSEK